MRDEVLRALLPSAVVQGRIWSAQFDDPRLWRSRGSRFAKRDCKRKCRWHNQGTI